MEKPIRTLVSTATAAAVIFILMVILPNSGGSTAWANIIKSMYEANNISIVLTKTTGSGEPEVEKVWVHLPNHFRHDEEDSTEIDNGIDLIRINHKNQTYYYSPSRNTFEPISSSGYIKFISLFDLDNPAREVDGLSAVKNNKESTTDKIVYDLILSGEEDDDATGSGKAFVDPITNRPTKVVMTVVSPDGQETKLNVDVEYDIIPDSTFELGVMKEYYSESPRESDGMMSGKVIDSEGNPVEGACVEVIGSGWGGGMLRGPKRNITDKSGNFFFTLPPITIPDGSKNIDIPAIVRAYKDGDNSIAWTIISKGKKADCPGSFGEVKTLAYLNSVNDIVLQMEPQARIAGKVIDVNGNPVPEVEISLRACLLKDSADLQNYKEDDILKDSNHLSSSYAFDLGYKIDYDQFKYNVYTKSDRNGYFEILHIPQLQNKTLLIINAKKEGYNDERVELLENPPLSPKDLNIKIYKTDIKVSGVLTNKDGKKLGGRFISFNIDGKKYLNRSHTNADGSFELELPGAENVTIEAELKEPYFYDIGGKYDKNKYQNAKTIVPYTKGQKSYKIKLVAGDLLTDK